MAIIGAGPAGLFLALLLAQGGVPCVVLERRNRSYVEGRVRAGLLEPATVELMTRLGVDARLRRKGLVHCTTILAGDGERFEIDLSGAAGGRAMTVYGQQDVMKDLFDAATQRGVEIVFDAQDVALHDLDSEAPSVSWRKNGAPQQAGCRLVAGCDGFHGVSRTAIPAKAQRTFEAAYPYAWLGVLADVPPCAEALVYARHARGFALASMRSPTRSRYYLQCPPETSPKAWSETRFWDEICRRLGPEAAAGVTRGPPLEMSVTPLRSFMVEPMRWGRLLLAGDAAHIVPPTGAKGLNLAAADAVLLAEAAVEYCGDGSERALDRYSERALARAWRAQRFSAWFTRLTHRAPDADDFQTRLQAAEWTHLAGSASAQASFAESYLGPPLPESAFREVGTGFRIETRSSS